MRKLWFWTYCNHNYDKHAVVCAWKCPPTPPVNVARQNKDGETSAYQHWSLGGRGWLVECDIEGVVGKVTPIENLFHLVRKQLNRDAISKNIVKESYEEFQNRIVQTFLQFPTEIIDNIIESMNKRIELVIMSKGNRIKY